MPFPLLRRAALAAVLCVAVASSAQAQTTSVLDDPAFEAEATRGLDLLYNMEFDRAEAIFDRLAARHPAHPVAPFLQALVPWWQILMDLSDTRHDDAFFDRMDEVIDRADRLLRRDGDNRDAKFFKGAALGFRGRLQSNRRSWLKAALDGKRAMGYVLDVADESDANADFLFGRGIYDYYAAAVPERYSWSKPFMAMFPAGSEARGLAALHRTFRDGTFLRAEAAYFLLQIYYIFERDYTKTLQFIGWLREEYPDNAFFHAMEGRIYSRFGDWDASERVFQTVMRRPPRAGRYRLQRRSRRAGALLPRPGSADAPEPRAGPRPLLPARTDRHIAPAAERVRHTRPAPPGHEPRRPRRTRQGPPALQRSAPARRLLRGPRPRPPVHRPPVRAGVVEGCWWTVGGGQV